MPEEQEALPGVEAVRAEVKAPPEPKPVGWAEVDPVARVLVDVPLAHLDRPFDYAVPATMGDEARPGVRVKVRFAGKDVDGYVVERAAETEHAGRLQPLRRVVSTEPVLTPEIARLSHDVARRYAGTRSDVLRLAVPPRHAGTEKHDPQPEPAWTEQPDPERWRAYRGGPDCLRDPRRAVLSVLPGDDWAPLLAEAVVATRTRGRGVLVCVPDHRDLDRLHAALTERIGAGHHVVLRADAGPAKRYGAFLALARGTVQIAIGTRAAAFAPVADLGLVAMWDDGDDLYDEPRAPYPHAREVLLLRAEQTGAAALLAAHARSVEAEYLLRTGWARELAAPREELRRRLGVAVAGDEDRDLARDPAARSARLPHEAFEMLRAGLSRGPVLVQAPRSGYATRLACDACRTPAECTRCHGPLRLTGPSEPPSCAWCGTPHPRWSCPECGNPGLRAPVLGDRRTAEEIGRAFPGVTVRTSSGDRVLEEVEDRPQIVVATPGAEPVTRPGYAGVLLMDTWLVLARSDLRAGEEAFRRWSNAAALARPGGRVLLVGDPGHPALQAMVRWDPGGLAHREIDERQSAHLPPASRVATLRAGVDDLEAALAILELPPGAEVLGPVPVDAETHQVVVRVPRVSGTALSEALSTMQALRSGRKLAHVRVEVDPAELG